MADTLNQGMDLPGAVNEDVQELDHKVVDKAVDGPTSKATISLPVDLRKQRRESRSSNAEPPSKFKCPSYTARLWEHAASGWQETHHFCAGLEVDLNRDPSNTENCQDVSDAANVTDREVHLPSTSLTALTQLQDSLKSPAGLLLDIAECGNVKFSELFTKMLAELGGAVPGSILQQAELLLHDHPYVTQERTPSKDDAVGEAIEVFVCSVSADLLDQPPLALARLAKRESVVCFEDDEGGGETRFAAVVLCDRKSATQGQALARLVATTFMDEEFVSVARSASNSTIILGALDTYLAQLTIVPTVKLNKAAAPRGSGPRSPQGEYLLSHSLVTGIQRRMSLVSPEQANLRAQEARRNSDASKESVEEVAPTSYFIEVDRNDSPEDGWKMERCLRQGLEVDLFVKADTPHLPRVSCHGLQLVKRLVVQDSVAIDVIASNPGSAIDAVLDRLTASGLPRAATGAVSKALISRARDGVEKQATSSELVDPAQGDEACLVLTLMNDDIPAETGVCAAFLRLKAALPMNFAANTPVRFLIALACNSDCENDLTELSESLAALAVDEDLILKMARAQDASAFVAAFESRLGQIVLLPHAHVHSRRNFEDDVLLSPKGAVPQPQSPKSSRAMKRKATTDEAGNVITSVKSDVGFDHMHKHGPGDDTDRLPSLQRHVWRAVGVLQKYALPLVTGVVMAMVWKNTDEASYWSVTHDPLIPGWQILGHDASLHFMVNDIFMCFFFGLAIKEVTEALLPGGSLSPLRRATNPLMATLGGVLGPVATYVVCCLIFEELDYFDGMICQKPVGDVAAADAHHRLLATTVEEVATVSVECQLADIINGWGVPTATDISLAWMFAILIFGAGHPAINYLLLLAIADDALGMAIIAIAYPNPEHPVEPVWLLLVVAGAVVAFLLRWAKVQFWSAYVFLAGPIAWFGLILAQVHPALALVFIVPFMPAHHQDHDDDKHESHAKNQVAIMRDLIPHKKSEMLIRAAQEFLAKQSAPLHAFEHHMKLFVDFGMFFFGLANAGVKVGGLGSLTWATVIALIAGKTLGIVAFSLSAHCMGFLLPLGLTVVDLFAMSALGGVGLTVALFVSNEAFTDKGLQSQAKMGALLSVASALLAFVIKFAGDRMFHRKESVEVETETQVEVVYSDEEVEADEWLDVVAMNDIMQVLWTQRKYQARGTALPIRQLVRSVSKNSTAWNSRMDLEGRSGACGRLSTPGSKEGREDFLARTSKNSKDDSVTRNPSKE